jgi:nucleotide-binding universal stress UspA family protein
LARAHEKTGQVLAATDFSEAAVPAVAAAVEEARLRGARLTLLHSIDAFPNPAIGWGAPFGASWVVPPPELVEEARKGTEEALRSTLQRFSAEGDVLTPVGDAATAILDAAHRLPADLVVLATRGRTGIARMVLGSVAERVTSLAPCSVLAVRMSHGG